MRTANIFGIAVVLGTIGLSFLMHDYKASLLRADCMYFKGYYEAWLKAGAPIDGDAFAKFREGRHPQVVVSNRLFVVGTTPYYTQLAWTNLRGWRSGTLYITTNRVMLLEEAPGEVKVVPDHKH